DDAVDLVGRHAGSLEGLLGRLPRHHRDGLVGRGDPTRLDPGPGLDPFVTGVDALDDVGVGNDLAGPVTPDAEHCGVPHDIARGCSRRGGWRGAPLSPPSPSHSTIVPPCGAMTGIWSRRLWTAPTCWPLLSDSTSRASPSAWKVPLAGATSSRQVGAVSI